MTLAWNWELDASQCPGCGICVDVCPHHALTQERDQQHPRVFDGQCIGCMDCVQQCPFGAIEVSFGTTCISA